MTRTPVNPHETFCLENASFFTAVRGMTPAKRIRREFPSIAEAEIFAASFGDGRTMIYAVTALGHSAHIRNA